MSRSIKTIIKSINNYEILNNKKPNFIFLNSYDFYEILNNDTSMKINYQYFLKNIQNKKSKILGLTVVDLFSYPQNNFCLCEFENDLIPSFYKFFNYKL